MSLNTKNNAFSQWRANSNHEGPHQTEEKPPFFLSHIANSQNNIGTWTQNQHGQNSPFMFDVDEVFGVKQSGECTAEDQTTFQ